MRRTITATVLMSVALVLSGCGREYSRVSLRKRLGPEGSRADASGLLLREGELVLFEALPRAAGERDYNGLEDFELYSSTPSVAIVRPSIAADSWVVNGVEAGVAELVVDIDGGQVDTLTIEVLR